MVKVWRRRNTRRWCWDSHLCISSSGQLRVGEEALLSSCCPHTYSVLTIWYTHCTPNQIHVKFCFSDSGKRERRECKCLRIYLANIYTRNWGKKERGKWFAEANCTALYDVSQKGGREDDCWSSGRDQQQGETRRCVYRITNTENREPDFLATSFLCSIFLLPESSDAVSHSSLECYSGSWEEVLLRLRSDLLKLLPSYSAVAVSSTPSQIYLPKTSLSVNILPVEIRHRYFAPKQTSNLVSPVTSHTHTASFSLSICCFNTKEQKREPQVKEISLFWLKPTNTHVKHISN